MTTPFIIYLIVLLIMSIVTYSAYGMDKKKAIKGKWRTKEKTLLLMSFFFGSIGGLFAMYHLRHKNKHWYFVVVNFISFIIHIALGVFLFNKTF
ncbi:DUF1294 domain-containing protein [Haploplasma axanthum]|uniref:Protein of uncharacterized function (DUF1294) n=1 Tax=Haploplasma axanthum TaxID=29552 RepID=A0A449BC42_HAPAX|nr:DUF1294 domain-containing protein [Haploplasma axanthum]VEU80014.1 Protein of uncharacterised function (DUF1294) [Haploplasma axanthum]